MMNKFMFTIVLLLFASLALVSAQDFTVTPSDKTLAGDPGQNVDFGTFIIKNNRPTVANLNIASVDLIGLSDSNKRILANKITITPASFSVAGGAQQNTGIVVAIPKGITSQFYKGTFQIKEGTTPVATFALTVGVNAIDNIEVILPSIPLVVSGQERDIRTIDFQISNDGSNTVTLNDDTSFSFLQSDFSDGDSDIGLKFDIATENLIPGATSPVKLTVNIPNNIEIDTYGGNIKLQGGSDPTPATFVLEVRVHPELCEDGPVGDITVNIAEPDNADEFAPGETINIEVDVDNDDTKDVSDVIVEAFLYNVDQDEEIERVESEPEDIDEGDGTTFDLDLEIPLEEDLDENDQYVLFVKAFEDGEEDKHCGEDQIDLDVEREKHDVRVKSIQIVPASAEPGEFVDVTVNVINIGSSDEDDVTVRIFEPDIGWDQTSASLDLEDGESNDNDGTVRFTFEVPEDAPIKTYSLEAVVTFDDGDSKSSEFAMFTVIAGSGKPETPERPQPADVLRVQSVSETSDNVFLVSTIVTNDATETKTFDIDVVASWASPIDRQTVVLNDGESRSVQFFARANQGLQEGKYTGTISVREGTTLIDSETFTSEVLGQAGTPTTPITGFNIQNIFGGNSGTVVWVLVDIVLVIVAIFFIRLIFTSGKSKKVHMKPVTTEKVKL